MSRKHRHGPITQPAPVPTQPEKEIHFTCGEAALQATARYGFKFLDPTEEQVIVPATEVLTTTVPSPGENGAFMDAPQGMQPSPGEFKVFKKVSYPGGPEAEARSFRFKAVKRGRGARVWPSKDGGSRQMPPLPLARFSNWSTSYSFTP